QGGVLQGPRPSRANRDPGVPARRAQECGEIQALTGVPGSSISQQLAILRGRGIVVAERAGTTIHYHAADPQIYRLLDAAREIFYGHLSDSAELLRLVEAEAEQVAISR